MLHVEGVTPEADKGAVPDADRATISRSDMASAWSSLNEGRVDVIVTAGRDVLAEARKDGVLTRLEASAVKVLPDVCWCSISEPVFPSRARALMTNSGRYAHYGPGLSDRSVRFGSLADCVEAAVTGKVAKNLPVWLS
jgi:predicted aconitase